MAIKYRHLKKWWFLGFVLLSITVCTAHEYKIEEQFLRNVSSSVDIFQKYVSSSSKSSACSSQLGYYLNGFYNKTEWALKMFDAGSKIPSGILEGNVVNYGSFDECLEVKGEYKEETIRGKYCMGFIPLTPILKLIEKNLEMVPRALSPTRELSATFATCLPEICTLEDIKQIYSGIVEFHERFCQSKSSLSELDAGAITTIAVFGIFLVIAVVSTLYDIYLHFTNKSSRHILLIAFSMLTNGKKLLSVRKSTDQISCLHGIRVISMMWVILGHRYLNDSSFPVINPKYLQNWKDDFKNNIIMNATLSVDTFFVLSGFLVAYVFLSAVSKGMKFNIFVFYLHRYIRLTPVLAMVVLLYSTVLKYLGSGPWWVNTTGGMERACRENWWSTLLYVQNYMPKKHERTTTCINQSWYLSVDMQLFVLSPILLIPLHRWPRIGLALTFGFSIMSMLFSALIGWFYKLRGFILANEDSETYMAKYYTVTHTRATPWLMGLALGYFVYQIKQNKIRVPVQNKITTVVVWLLSLGILLACIYTGHDTPKKPYHRLANSLYITLMRPAWSIGVIGVILMCVLGRGGPINWFLSTPYFQVTSKLTYCMYLLHMVIQVIQTAQTRVVPHVTELNIISRYFGDYLLTMLLSVVFTLLFESPILTIEKLIFGLTKTINNNELIKNKP